MFRGGYATTPKLTKVKEETAQGQPQRGVSPRLERFWLPTAPGSILGFWLLITYSIKQLAAFCWKIQQTLGKDDNTCMKQKAELASFLSLLTHICLVDFLLPAVVKIIPKLQLSRSTKEIQAEYQLTLRESPVQIENAAFLDSGNSYLPA